MTKIGYIVKVKAKGREYFYLRKSVRGKNNMVRKETIFSFGTKEKAFSKLLEWKYDLSLLPNELKKLGYDLEDVEIWINQINKK